MKLLESLPEKLTKPEEQYLAERIQKTAKEDDINKLVLHSMRDGFLYSKRVSRARIADDELFSLCYRALYRNAKRYQPNRGVRFIAFAKAGIRGAVCRYWKTLDVVKNSSVHEDKDLKDCHPNKSNGPSEYGEGEELDIPPGSSEPSVEPDFQSIETREQMQLVNAAMEARLTEQERMVVDLCYKDGFSYQEVGNLLNITRSAVLLAHTKALKKIRLEMGSRRRLLKG
jgi:RNA polymerase sigma factor (sigma-70 family)